MKASKIVKIVSLALALVLACAAFAGCGSKKATLTMGTNATFPPYEFYEGDKIVGIDAEVAQLIADKLDMELVIKDMEFEGIIGAVQAGSIDIGMAGMTVNDERKKSVDFTDSYAKGIQVVIVKEDSTIKSTDDQRNKRNAQSNPKTVCDMLISAIAESIVNVVPQIFKKSKLFFAAACGKRHRRNQRKQR